MNAPIKWIQEPLPKNTQKKLKKRKKEHRSNALAHNLNFKRNEKADGCPSGALCETKSTDRNLLETNCLFFRHPSTFVVVFFSFAGRSGPRKTTTKNTCINVWLLLLLPGLNNFAKGITSLEAPLHYTRRGPGWRFIGKEPCVTKPEHLQRGYWHLACTNPKHIHTSASLHLKSLRSS